MIQRHSSLAVIVLAIAAALPPAAASAQPEGPAGTSPVRRELTGQLGASFNNPGLQNTLDLAWVKPIGDSNRALLADARIAAGIVSVTTPTMTRLGGWVEYAPLSIVSVRAGVEPAFYFGSFTSLMPFASYDAPFDKDVLKTKAGTQPGVGVRSYITPSLQMRAGPIVARAGGDFERWRSSADGPYYYEATRDQLLASGGDHLINATGVAMYEHATAGGGYLSAGPIYGVTRVFDARANQSRRLGIIAVRQFASTHLRLPNPRLTVLMYRYLEDRSKQGGWGGALALAFHSGRPAATATGRRR